MDRTRPSPPARIAKYAVSAELGRGATGIVYLAKDGFFSRQVAIKCLRQEASTDAAAMKRRIQSFRVEASLVGKLKHPHVVAMLDADLDNDPPYLVMEYVEGKPLSAFTAPDALLPVNEVLSLGFKCCDALGYAAELGLIHRDIKPANLLLTPDGDVKITDFGTADWQQLDVTRIETAGSPAYMSPEQVKGEPLTWATDIYSLGVTLYQLLTGEMPFEAESEFALMYKIGNERPVPPSVRRPALPLALDEVIMRALAIDLNARYATWDAFAQALTRFLSASAQPDQAGETDAEKIALLRTMPLLKDFPPPLLWSVLRLGVWAQIKRGQRLIHEGALGDSFYLLVEGEVIIEREGIELSRDKAGYSLGEMVYILPGARRRSATVTALTDLQVLKIPCDTLGESPVELRSQFDRAFLSLLATRLIEANRRYTSFDL
ncbi:serine/threonine-protein kinase [Chitinimonas sp. BJYL2]|uniref:serine/threonine-protein kinase n=1 Tax=Chitinimonas sp. BJYL2 TaxID=2976696 RepID=UPI0022B3739F|nr:serine/threonine-protein kinase [Chitinimonas sp. BJYL2]